jgi:hypothetical protein
MYLLFTIAGKHGFKVIDGQEKNIWFFRLLGMAWQKSD